MSRTFGPRARLNLFALVSFAICLGAPSAGGTPAAPAEAPESSAPASAVSLQLACRPNPFGGNARISWMQPTAGRALVEVFDLQGRRVRRLVDGVCGVGEGRTEWNGARDDGRPTPAGIYWVVVRAGTQEARERVARVE